MGVILAFDAFTVNNSLTNKSFSWRLKHFGASTSWLFGKRLKQ